MTGYRGELVFDPSRPDGTPQKLLDISKLRAPGLPEKPVRRLPSDLREVMQTFLPKAVGTALAKLACRHALVNGRPIFVAEAKRSCVTRFLNELGNIIANRRVGRCSISFPSERAARLMLRRNLFPGHSQISVFLKAVRRPLVGGHQAV